MLKFIATYDLVETNPSPHSAFLNHAVKNGWYLWIRGDNHRDYRLPNTTLHGLFANREAAAVALEKTRAGAEAEMKRRVTMSKWIVAEYASALFNSDQIG